MKPYQVVVIAGIFWFTGLLVGRFLWVPSEPDFYSEKEHGWDMHATNCGYCDEVRKNAQIGMDAMDRQIKFEFWLAEQKEKK